MSAFGHGPCPTERTSFMDGSKWVNEWQTYICNSHSLQENICATARQNKNAKKKPPRERYKLALSIHERLKRIIDDVSSINIQKWTEFKVSIPALHYSRLIKQIQWSGKSVEKWIAMAPSSQKSFSSWEVSSLWRARSAKERWHWGKGKRLVFLGIGRPPAGELQGSAGLRRFPGFVNLI